MLGYYRVAPAGPEGPRKPRPSGKVLFLLFLIVALVCAPAIYKRGLSWHVYDAPGVSRTPLRGMAWAVRFGYNNRGWPNHADVAKVNLTNPYPSLPSFNFLNFLRSLLSSLSSLLFSDNSWPENQGGWCECGWFGGDGHSAALQRSALPLLRPLNLTLLANWDVVEYLEEHLHMYSDYGPPTTTESWGCALLSAFPIRPCLPLSLPLLVSPLSRFLVLSHDSLSLSPCSLTNRACSSHSALEPHDHALS